MIDKKKILAGVKACINPNISNCQECPYWENGRKNCEELRMDICEAVHTALTLINVHQLEYDKCQLMKKELENKKAPFGMWWERGE